MLMNIKIDKSLLKELKIKAIEENTTMYALTTQYLKKGLENG